MLVKVLKIHFNTTTFCFDLLTSSFPLLPYRTFRAHLAIAYSSSFCSFHSENELISFCLLAANSAEALFDLGKIVERELKDHFGFLLTVDLWASFWLNLTLYFFKFFLISLICSLDSSVGGLGETLVYFKFKRT